jgi:hypothetical protein
MAEDTEAYYGNPNIVRQGRSIRERPKVDISPEAMEMAAGFHPLIGPALSARDFATAGREGDAAGMGLSALGMIPVVGGAVKPISKILKAAPSGTDILNTFKTSRGSAYAHHADNTTTRNRSGAMHRDTTEGVQPRSGKTIFVDPKDANMVGGLFQNTDMSTKVVPKFDSKGVHIPGKAELQLAEDFGPRKAGTVLHEFSYGTNPKVGSNPVEIYRSESPIGNAGTGIHFGTAITEVTPQVVTKKAGGSVQMPQEYSQGSWKLI